MPRHLKIKQKFRRRLVRLNRNTLNQSIFCFEISTKFELHNMYHSRWSHFNFVACYHPTIALFHYFNFRYKVTASYFRFDIIWPSSIIFLEIEIYGRYHIYLRFRDPSLSWIPGKCVRNKVKQWSNQSFYLRDFFLCLNALSYPCIQKRHWLEWYIRAALSTQETRTTISVATIY